VGVQLPGHAPPGLYVGELKDPAGHPMAYTIYVSDVA
jgi:hypothetical protein